MKKTKRQRPAVARPTVPVIWPKTDPNGKQRFELACAREGGVPGTVARALCDEWARIVLAKPESDVTKASRALAKKKKK